MSDKKRGYHEEGQKDASEGKYNSPGGILVISPLEDIVEYSVGHGSTRGQIDGAQNEYNPPPLDNLGREAYDEAWQAAYDNREE